jgi:hypothetical protein
MTRARRIALGEARRPDPWANLSACENAWSSRDRSRLTPSDVAAIPAEAVGAAPVAGQP